LVLIAIALATFVSEDLTCLGVGLLVAAGRADLWLGLAGCAGGIVAGDLGLWLLGRVGGAGLSRWLPPERLRPLDAWLDRHGGRAVLASRFLPGTRLPLYVAAGVLGWRPGRFALWVLLGALVWVPLLVVSVALGGAAVAGPLSQLLGSAGLPLLGLAVAAVVLAVRVGRERLGHHEFWPAWLFYLPLAPWLAWLSLRHRGLTVWTAANPGIPAGGVVGESKAAILDQLNPEAVIPFFVVPPAAPGDRRALFRVELARRGWSYPLVLKPDAAQRGAGVRKVREASAAERYLAEQPAAVLVQPYHPGPYEAGIFYVRFPGEEGRIFSITDKVFPAVVGDGRSTLEELIRVHPRYNLQAGTFLARHASRLADVLPAGERFALAVAGNHCQGTLFRDGSHLWTPELEAAIDRVALPFTGFFIGRFDVRYTDAAAFRAGRDLAVVELNGATAESTNIYDPDWSVWRAWRVLFRQWALLYAVGAANRRRGHAPVSALRLLRQVRRYYRDRVVDVLAD
jgi:membrane protein DedA with SNARE-associated domain